MGRTGWGEVGKNRGGEGKFLSLEDGDTVTLRLLDEEPYTVHVHKVSFQGDDGEEIFRSIPQTPKPDEDYIDSQTNRFPAEPRHSMRCVVIEDDEPKEIKVLSGGTQIFKTLKKLSNQHGDIRQFDVILSREGEGLKTQYTVATKPGEQTEIDVDEWVEKLDDDWSFASLFPDITPAQQKKIIDDAKIDITYDPVAELMEDMTIEEALEVRVTFGQYGTNHYPKGMKLKDVMAVDDGYLSFISDKVTSRGSEQIVAAARTILENMDQITAGKKKGAIGAGKKGKVEEEDAPPPKKPKPTSGKPPKKQEEEEEEEQEETPPPKKPVTKPVPGKAGAKKTKEFDRDEMLTEAKQLLADNDNYSEALAIVKLIRKHGKNPKLTKIKDLDDDQLVSLVEQLREEAE